MNRMRLLVLLPFLAVLLAPTGTALADTTPASVVQSLRNDPVFVEPDAEGAGDVDAAKVRKQISEGSRQIYVVVLPQRAADKLGSAEIVGRKIAGALPAPAVLVALVGKTYIGLANGTNLAAGQAQQVVDAASGSGTDKLVEAVRNLQQVNSGSGSTQVSGGSGDTSSGGSGVLLPIVAVGALGGGAFLYSRKRRRQKARTQELEGMRADVESLYNRLGSDVSTIPGGDDAVAKQALSDAAERYNATGALLSHADSPGEFAAARRTAVEGLVAARTARQKLGLDPGPEIPLPPAEGPQLTAEQKVRVGDQEYDGSPSYQPGRGHYFGGGYYQGQMVPGGWYAFPFWETMLMTSMMTGGFGGGGLFGGGYGYGGGGYGAGYEEGREDAQDSGNDGGGFDGWGGGGGGGDFGGWGGGGGDMGGGDMGGGGGDGGGGGW